MSVEPEARFSSVLLKAKKKRNKPLAAISPSVQPLSTAPSVGCSGDA